jgi:NADH-quinone oxidoreductase subunit C
MASTDASPILDVLRAAVPDAALNAAAAVDMPTIVIDREHALGVFAALRDHPALQFALLLDVTAVDRLPAEPRFEIVYHLACLGEAFASGTPAPARRLRVKIGLPGHDARVTSVTSLYPGAGWPEREVFDLFGVFFEHHADLRRILTPEEWTGHPLRKDYPVQIRKSTQSWEPIQVSAEEFAENIRRQRAEAERRAREAGQSGD